MTVDLRQCNRQGCGKMFMPTRRWQIYCSTQCRNYAFYMRLVERNENKPTPPHATPLPSAYKHESTEDYEAVVRKANEKQRQQTLEDILDFGKDQSDDKNT